MRLDELAQRFFVDVQQRFVMLDHGHCQTNLNGPAKVAGLKRSGRQLTPLGQGGSAVLFEGIAHPRRLGMSPARLKPICSDNAMRGAILIALVLCSWPARIY
jgi:hypothetical protein